MPRPFHTRVGAAAFSLSLALLTGAGAATAVLGFDGLPDLHQVTGEFASPGGSFPGVTFEHTTVRAHDPRVNEYPPRSGTNIVFDEEGPISGTFTSPAAGFRAYFTYKNRVTIRAYNSAGSVIATVQSRYAENYTSSGNPPNELLAVAAAEGIARFAIEGDPLGDSIAMDDFTAYVSSEAPPAPELTNILATAMEPFATRITWSTDWGAAGTVEYGRTPTLGRSAAGAAGVTDHSVHLTGLTPGALYYFRVRSTTTGGAAPASESASGLYAFRNAPLVSGAMSLGYSLARESSGVIRARVTLFNNTGMTQRNVRITRGVLRASATANTSTPLPLALGDIPAGGSASTSLSFPGSVGGSGASGILSVGWSSGTLSSGSSFRIALP